MTSQATNPSSLRSGALLVGCLNFFALKAMRKRLPMPFWLALAFGYSPFRVFILRQIYLLDMCCNKLGLHYNSCARYGKRVEELINSQIAPASQFSNLKQPLRFETLK